MTQSRVLSALSVFCLSPAVVLALLPAPARAAERAPWKAGVASVAITPRQPLWMAGYASRKKPSEGVAQELYAKALALEDGRGNRVVLITSDLLGFPRALSDPIAERVRQRYGLRRDRILFTSSHTHSGPVLRASLIGMYDLDAQQAAAVQDYSERLREQVVELAGAALKDLAPARLSFGRGQAGFAINRRERREKGVALGLNPQGPVDHEVPVIRIERPDGSLRAVLFGYACHNTTLGGDYYQFHGDYAGVAQEVLEKKHPGVTALFVLGCGGDANPNPRGTVEHARAHGEALAAAVDSVLNGKTRPIAGPVRTAYDQVDMPFATPPSRDELQARLQDKDVYRKRHAQALLKTLDEKGKLPTHYPYPVQVLQFGKDLTLVALAGEVVIDYALRLKRELGADKLWVAGYSNDVFAYIVSKRVLAEGGYEPVTSMVYYGQPGPWAPEAEDAIIAKVHKLVRKVR